MQALDRSIFKAINTWPSNLESAMSFFSLALDQLWVKILLLIMLGAMIAVGKDTRRGAICALLAVLVGDGITHLFKIYIPMPRPCNDPTLPDVILRIGATQSAGTASAHAANMMAVAVCFFVAMRWWSMPWFLLAILVGLSRIYNGVHYPYQVLLGWTCGAFAGVLVSVVWQKIADRMAKKSGPGNKESVEATVEKAEPSI